MIEWSLGNKKENLDSKKIGSMALGKAIEPVFLLIISKNHKHNTKKHNTKKT